MLVDAAIVDVHTDTLDYTGTVKVMRPTNADTALGYLFIKGTSISFAQAARDGRDVRFTKSDNTPLNFEIERWDSTSGMAELWVTLDTIYGNDNSRHITMYWGNPDAAEKANTTGVFDTIFGYQGVWHLAEMPGMYIWDASPNHYDGIPYGMSEGSFVEGVIGKAQKFDGIAGYIAFPSKEVYLAKINGGLLKIAR